MSLDCHDPRADQQRDLGTLDADGQVGRRTRLAFDVDGNGPPIIFVGGAFDTRRTTAPLAAAMRDRFTTFNFDRRGRGDSEDTPPYTVEREIDDLYAVIGAAGGSAAVFGYSSGATLALKAAARIDTIDKLAVYDAPFAVDDSHPRLPAGFADDLERLIAAGHRGDAVELYQRVAVGLPEDLIVAFIHLGTGAVARGRRWWLSRLLELRRPRGPGVAGKVECTLAEVARKLRLVGDCAVHRARCRRAFSWRSRPSARLARATVGIF